MFKRTLIITIVAVFFLIFIGSVVRSSGAGMGCPDWPKCYGKIIPPSSEAQLESNYKEFYANIRKEKNIRLEKLFVILGLEEVLHDRQINHSTYQETTYDFQKAWIEYLNRVSGVIVGFLVLGCFLFSFSYIKKDRSIFLLSLLSLIILLIEAFLGSVVVSSGLFPDLISLHMILALVLLFVLLFIYIKINPPVPMESAFTKKVYWISLLGFIVTFIQMFLGIEVREMVDYLHNERNIYEGIIDYLPSVFYIHRSFSVLVLAVNVWVVIIVGRYGVNNTWSRFILPIIVAEIFFGTLLGYFDLPSFSQPFHLLLGSLLVSMQFMNLLYVKFVNIK